MDLFISSKHVDATSKRRSPSWVVITCLFSVFLFLLACSGEEEASQKNLTNEAASDSGDSDKKGVEETATSSSLASSSVTTADDSGEVRPVDEKETTASAKEVTTATNKPTTTEKKTSTTKSEATTTTAKKPSYLCPTDWCVQGGTLEAIFTDCVSYKVLDEDGSAKDSGQVSCDGGSFIIVDGVQIRTASGYVISDQFNKHPKNLPLGSKVNVQAQKTSYNAEVFTLNCQDCNVVRSYTSRALTYQPE